MGFWGAPITISVVPTNPVDNDVSTRETVTKMIAVAKVCSNSPQIINVVASLIRSLRVKPSKSDLARAIFWWVKNHIRFMEDEQTLYEQMGYKDVNQELLISPIALLSMPQPQGDCDDFSMLFASLCLAARIPVWFVTIAVDEDQPNRWSHVFCCAGIDGQRVPMDCSHGPVPGWETQREVFRRAEWFVG